MYLFLHKELNKQLVVSAENLEEARKKFIKVSPANEIFKYKVSKVLMIS